jgi:uncharacterized protein YqcC (DUF446 family)
MTDLNTAATQAIDTIEIEMKRIGLWQEEPLPAEAYDFRSAFAIDTMAFSQWLQFILVPRVRGLISAGGAFPAESHVAAQGVREFDGQPETDQLIALLSNFDALFNGS